MRLLALVLGLWMAATSLVAQDRDGIEEAIGSQLEAFSQRDVTGAWEYASPNIKRLFGTPDNFGMMVRQGYPMVWDNADVEFLELRDVLGFLWQRVLVRDRSGNFHMLEYQMINTPEGWQINGVNLLQMPDVGA